MSRNSESGYSSDENTISPQEQIALDQRRFAKKYDVEEEMMRSVNEIIYTGRNISTEERVVIKQIPRGKISEFKQSAFNEQSAESWKVVAATDDEKPYFELHKRTFSDFITFFFDFFPNCTGKKAREYFQSS